MHGISLTDGGAVSALIMVAGFFVGIAVLASSGVEVLIPETGTEGLEWLADVDDAGHRFVAGASIVVFAGLFGLAAFLGFHEALRGAGPLMLVALVAGVVGIVLVTISHATPIAMALELAPSYTNSSGSTRATLGVTATHSRSSAW